MGNKSEWFGAIGVIAVAVLCLIISIAVGRSIGKGGYLALEPAKLLFPTLIQINITLIGFWGIILVYYLKSLHEYTRYFHAVAGKAIRRVEDLSLNKQSFSNDEKKIIDAWLKITESFHDGVDDMRILQRDFTGFGIFVVICFISSVVVSVLSFGYLEEVGVATSLVTWSLFPLLLGIAFMIIGIRLTTPAVPKKWETPYSKRKG